MRDMLTSGAKTRMKLSNLDQENTSIWTTVRINKLLEDFESGEIDIKTLKNSPFKDNDPSWKKAKLLFEYTPEEQDEIKKCKADPVYFAMNYAQIMTENGVQLTPLYDYQEEIIHAFQRDRFCCLMASRQIGKTVMSGIFIAWFLIFHADKNVLAVANIATTTKEVIDKIKSVLENLPFFMKPGCVSNNVMSMKFDNGCRLIGRTTTKNTGIGFTIHLLYIDEFAHINPSYLDFFYRAIYPTITGAGSKSKVIMSSTPNGMNRFHDIYMAAVAGTNSYTPLRVDWWQVPGRDEEWKKMTIANLGSEEDFNQEYGLQFFSSDKLLLPSKDLKKVFKVKTKYIIPEWTQEPDKLELFDGFSAHPNFAKLTPDDIRNDGNYYVFSIDTADGLNRDYSVINIFKFITLPTKMLDQVKEFIKNDGDFFGLVQVATFRTNKKDINEYCNVLEKLLYEIFNPERIKIIVELNHKGEYVMDKISQNPNYSTSQMIHSKHTQSSIAWKPGIKLTESNRSKFCERFKFILAVNKIIPNEFRTVYELGSFGRSSNGTYRSQSGNDDLAMTCVNTAAFFESPNFWELVNDMVDTLPKEHIQKLRQEYLDEVYTQKGTSFNYTELKELNDTPSLLVQPKQAKFNVDSIPQYAGILEEFYGKNNR